MREEPDSGPERGAPEVPASSGATFAASEEERALVERLRRGDEAAFTTLVDQYHGSLVRLARSFVADQAAAEEVAQDTWVGVLTGLATFEGRSSLKTWLFRILTNRAKTRGVREARSTPWSALSPGGEAPEPAVDPGRFDDSGMWSAPPRPWQQTSAEAVLLREETMKVLEAALGELPAGQRAVVTLNDVEGLTAEEICNILEIQETNRRVLLHRGRSRLRQILEAHLSM